MFADLPVTAAWRHVAARDGFESVFVAARTSGYRLEGHTAAVEDGQVWAVQYSLTVDRRWATQSARVTGRSAAGGRTVRLDLDAAGRWTVDDVARPDLDGCVDVDLEASACTNALPVRRLRLEVGEAADAPAVYVRAPDLAVERLEQRYARVADADGGHRYEYESSTFDVACLLAYDGSGLVVDYPGIATRVS